MRLHTILTHRYIGGRSFFAPSQRAWRDKLPGYFAATTADATIHRLALHDTGAATLERLDPDGDLWRQLTGSWGRVIPAGRP